ncbi:MAG: serine protease [Acidobacteriota bacterium]
MPNRPLNRALVGLLLLALPVGATRAEAQTDDLAGRVELGFPPVIVPSEPIAPDLEGAVQLDLPAVDLHAAQRRDEARIDDGRVAHFAAVLPVDTDPWREALRSWDLTDDGLARWRLHIASPGALSLSLAFSRFDLPRGARLVLRDAAGRFSIGPFTARDRDEHGELWTPPLPTDDLLLELTLPLAGFDQLQLDLERVHHGYAGFGEPSPVKAGACHADVACLDDPDAWRDPARAVGLVSIEGVRYCTGFLINNTAQDGRPLFVTAGHCGIDESNASSVVVIWNHQLETCDGTTTEPGPQFQTGAILRAVDRRADIALIELDDPPPPPAQVAWAGWDRSDDEPVRAAAIHHPNTDRKRIALTDGPVHAAHHLQKARVRGADHLRVSGWTRGTTEGGSSGSPLFNEDFRAVGVLHGGYAACGNGDADWFGRLSAAWDGDEAGERLRDWLDPLGTQTVVLDAMAPELPDAEAFAPRR